MMLVLVNGRSGPLHGKETGESFPEQAAFPGCLTLLYKKRGSALRENGSPGGQIILKIHYKWINMCLSNGKAGSGGR